MIEEHQSCKSNTALHMKHETRYTAPVNECGKIGKLRVFDSTIDSTRYKKYYKHTYAHTPVGCAQGTPYCSPTRK